MYKDIWNPTIGEKLGCEREKSNTQDPYAVTVMRRRTTVGHVPRKILSPAPLLEAGASLKSWNNEV